MSAAAGLDLPAPPKPRLSFKSKFLDKAKALTSVTIGKDQVEIREKEGGRGESRAGLMSQLKEEARKSGKEEEIDVPTDLKLSQEEPIVISPTGAEQEDLPPISTCTPPPPSSKPRRRKPKSRLPKSLSRFLDISAAEGDSEDDNVSNHYSDYSETDSEDSDVSDLVDDRDVEDCREHSQARLFIEQQLKVDIGVKRPQLERLETEDRSLMKRIRKVEITGKPVYEIKEKDPVQPRHVLENSPGEEAEIARFRADKERWRLKTARERQETLLDSASHEVLSTMHIPQACLVPRSLLHSSCK